MENTAGAKKQYSYVWLMYTAFIAVIYLSGILIIKVTPIVEVSGDAISWIMTILTTYVIGIPVLALLLKKAPTEAPQRNKVSFGWLIAFFLMAITLSLTSSLIGSPIIRVINSITGNTLSSGGAESAIKGSGFIWFIVVVVIIGPIFEELAFRKLLIDRIYKYGEGMAIVVSGIAFALFHQNMTQFFYTAAMGMVLAYVYIRTGSILNAIGLHIACNFVTGLIMRNADTSALSNITSMSAEEQITLLMPLLSVMLVLAVLWIAGLIILIVYLKKKKFHLSDTSAKLPKGKRKIAFVNLGFAAYVVVVIILMTI